MVQKGKDDGCLTFEAESLDTELSTDDLMQSQSTFTEKTEKVKEQANAI